MNDFNLINSINNLNGSIKTALENFNTFVNYVSHPILIWQGFTNLSYYIVLFVGASGIILYAFGYKKGMKWPTIGVGVYTLIQAINLALK